MPEGDSGSSEYDSNTINAANPMARFAHRTRIKKSILAVADRLDAGHVFDYGCGSGHFVEELNRIKPGCAVGYEPYMDCERPAVYQKFDEAKAQGPFLRSRCLRQSSI